MNKDLLPYEQHLGFFFHGKILKGNGLKFFKNPVQLGM